MILMVPGLPQFTRTCCVRSWKSLMVTSLHIFFMATDLTYILGESKKVYTFNKP